MNWEQKLEALQALTEHTLNMRKPGDWYVFAAITVGGDGGGLKGQYGNGASPEAAVLDHWQQLAVDITPDEYLVVNNGDDRIYRRWNGFMWQDAKRMATAT